MEKPRFLLSSLRKFVCDLGIDSQLILLDLNLKQFIDMKEENDDLVLTDVKICLNDYIANLIFPLRCASLLYERL